MLECALRAIPSSPCESPETNSSAAKAGPSTMVFMSDLKVRPPKLAHGR